MLPDGFFAGGRKAGRIFAGGRKAGGIFAGGRKAGRIAAEGSKVYRLEPKSGRATAVQIDGPSAASSFIQCLQKALDFVKGHSGGFVFMTSVDDHQADFTAFLKDYRTWMALV